MKRGINGPKNRIVGNNFERFLEIRCAIQKILYIKMPLGGKRVGKRFVQIKTPFDYILCTNSHAVFIDCKTFEGAHISYSMLTRHQIVSLHDIMITGNNSGYLCWHRTINEVVFYHAFLLTGLRPKESLAYTDGLLLGPIESFDLNKLFANT